MTQRPIGILGGTFDPIHVGHLRTAHELLTGLGLEEVRFVPARLPPHRPPAVAPEALRLRLLEAALAGVAGFRVDDRELGRSGPSYMVDTLISLRTELGTRPLCLILGFDAFMGLPTWHRWQEILELAHLVVARRPGYATTVDAAIGALLEARAIQAPAMLAGAPAGHILFRDVTQLEVSASAIRGLMATGGDPRYLVPDAVRDLLLKTHVYANPGEVQISAQ